MTTVAVVVKHVGKKYDVELDTTAPASVFKQQLTDLTGVPGSRQKILSKGAQIKDDTDLAALGLKPGHTFMLLGSAAAIPSGPSGAARAADAAAAAAAAAAEASQAEPQGLVNVGNTCYANATLQALATVDELSKAVRSYHGNDMIVRSMGTVFKNLEVQGRAAQAPSYFIQAVRSKFPQFNEISQHGGGHKQQDAEELWTELAFDIRNEGLADAEGNTVSEHFMQGKFVTELSSVEAPEETPQLGEDTFDKLSCHITISTNFLKDGLLAGLREELEKHSDTLGRDARYTLTRRISRLPKYLTVHFVRFFWRRDTKKKSKILRKVAFPFQLDVTDMCTDDLKAKLVPARDQFREMESAFEEAKRAARRARFNNVGGGPDDKRAKIEETLPQEKQDELRAAVRAKIDPDIAADVGANPYGIYDLQAVITHQGMSADSGHYQAFTRNAREPGTWWRFNDDKVSLVDDAKIESLSGGGESDSALILLYRTADV